MAITYYIERKLFLKAVHTAMMFATTPQAGEIHLLTTPNHLVIGGRSSHAQCASRLRIDADGRKLQPGHIGAINANHDALQIIEAVFYSEAKEVEVIPAEEWITFKYGPTDAHITVVDKIDAINMLDGLRAQLDGLRNCDTRVTLDVDQLSLLTLGDWTQNQPVNMHRTRAGHVIAVVGDHFVASLTPRDITYPDGTFFDWSLRLGLHAETRAAK